jgi:Stress responsive A/B Barrel Domain
LVEHIVLIRWTEEASRAAIDSAMAELWGLKDKIAGIVELSVGANFSERAKGFTHGMVVRFTDRAALEAYGPHPEHQRVVQNVLGPIRADILIFDFQL